MIFGFLKILPGPVPAVTEALKKAGLTIKDMDLVEVCDTHRRHCSSQTCASISHCDLEV